MDIRELADGERCTDDDDRITISKSPLGGFTYSGNVLTHQNGVTFDHVASFPTRDQAKEAGIAWAAGLGAQTLCVEQRDA